MDLRGQHVLVTGGSKGLGASLAREFAGRGARLTLLARPSDELEQIAAETGGVALPVDLSRFENLDHVIARAEKENGPLGVLVNNAALVRLVSMRKLTAEDLQAQMNTNVVAPMELTRQAIPDMIERNRGLVVTVSSFGAEVLIPQNPCYSVSKSGLSKFGQDLREELRHTGVRTLLVTIGVMVGTQISDQIEQDPVFGPLMKRFGRLGQLTAEQVAHRVAQSIVTDKETLVLPRIGAPLVYSRLLPQRLASRFAGGITAPRDLHRS